MRLRFGVLTVTVALLSASDAPGALAQSSTSSNSRQCSISGIQSQSALVDNACCVPASVCSTGAPNACNSMCAHVFLRFYNGCYDQLSAIATGHLDSFDALAVKCGRIAPDNSCLSDNHKAQILTDLQCAETTNNVQERLTCLSRIRGVLGLEGEGAGKSPEQCTKLSLELPLLEDTADDSGNGHTAMVHGDAFVADGAHFDGEGDYMTVNSFNYGATADFTIGMWITKESCTASIYEYLFSQSKYPTGPSVPHPAPGQRNPSPPNPNINMYLGCEENGGGWSQLGGTILRFNLYDDEGVGAMFDYPLWNANSSTRVLNRWIHMMLTVDKNVMQLHIDGKLVPDTKLGFYSHAGITAAYECVNNAACNPQTLTPQLAHLQSAFTSFTMNTTIFIGGRNDLNLDRGFLGKVAGLIVSTPAVPLTAVQCLYSAEYHQLPSPMQACSAMLAEMRLGHNFLLDMPFLHGSTKDISSFDRKLTAYGGKVVVGQGASFNGYGDYIAIQNFDYASDGDFSISMWFTKGACNQESPFEYVYSHNEYPTGNQSGIQNTKNSNINLYIGCESTGTVAGGGGGKGSTQGGTVLRTNLMDSAGTWVIFDFNLAQSGNFDSITHTWTNIVLGVSRHSVVTYIDGILTSPTQYGFPRTTDCSDMQIKPTCAAIVQKGYPCSTDMSRLTQGNPEFYNQRLSSYCAKSCKKCGLKGSVTTAMLSNSGYPFPSRLRTPLVGFTLNTDIHLGARADLDPKRHFFGKIAQLIIYDSSIKQGEATCLFTLGDSQMAGIPPAIRNTTSPPKGGQN